MAAKPRSVGAGEVVVVTKFGEAGVRSPPAAVCLRRSASRVTKKSLWMSLGPPHQSWWRQTARETV